MKIEELHVGCHVLAWGEKAKIESLPGGGEVGYIKADGDWEQTDICHIEPIQITEELLKDIGFFEEKPPVEGWTYGVEKVFSKMYDAPIECEDPYISLAQYEGGLYQLQVEGTFAFVRYLHELENFTFMTTKKELI